MPTCRTFSSLSLVVVLVGCGGASGKTGGMYSASITPTPAPVLPGVQTRLDITVASPSGAPVTSFTELHTATMHLILVSQDLEDLRHVHPMLQPDGHLTVNATLARAEPYKAFLEFQPSGSGEQLATTMLTPLGANPTLPAWDTDLAFTGSSPMRVHVDQTSVQLSTAPNAPAEIQAGVTAHLMIEVRASDMMSPANVEDYLGMGGHAIVLSGDLGMFFHLHALRGGSGTAGMNMPGMRTPGMTSMPVTSMPGMNMPGSSSSSDSMEEMPDPMYAGPTTDDLTYDVTFPAPGLYKVFFQFQRAGRVVTATFLVLAS